MNARTGFHLGLGATIAAAVLLMAASGGIAGNRLAQAQPGEGTSAPAPAPPLAAPQVPAALPPDVAFGRFIALIRADLRTADELVKKRDWSDAARHVMFPLEEIYGVIREDLRTYKTPPFDGALKALARTVKARNAKQYPKALQKVEAALAAADTALKDRQPDWPRFTVALAIATLKATPEEYDDAVSKDRIVRTIGYQMARGIILEADRLIEGVAGELEAKDADALRNMREGFAALKQGFADVQAPKRPVLDSATIGAIVANIEVAARALM